MTARDYHARILEAIWSANKTGARVGVEWLDEFTRVLKQHGLVVTESDDADREYRNLRLPQGALRDEER